MGEGTGHNFEEYLQAHSADIETAVHELWGSRTAQSWQNDPRFYIRLGETADRLGQAMFAQDILKEGLRFFPDNLRLNQLNALALIKCGFLNDARAILTGLADQGHKDEETLGILGRVYKDMWSISGGPEGDHSLLERSRACYLQAFRHSGGYYSGINAASLSCMFGDKNRAEKLSRRVLRICLDQLKKGGHDYWLAATVGEGLVLLGRHQRAEHFFTLGKKLAGRNYSCLASTRKQLSLLRHYIDIPDQVLRPLRIPPVVAFTGHMLDRPGRKKARFPGHLVEKVKAEIAEMLAELGAGIGYASAACGSDVLFLECMQERKGETNVILPFDLDDFMAESVEHAGPEWRERAGRVLQNATVTGYATEGRYLNDDLLFDYTNRIIMGKTLLRSEVLDTEPVLLAVWDGKKDNQPGGTGSFLRLWDRAKARKEIIDLRHILKHTPRPVTEAPVHTEQVLADGGGTSAAGAFTGRKPDETQPDRTKQDETKPDRTKSDETKPAPANEPVTQNRQVRALLFADLAGFSKIQEEQIPFFMDRYLGAVAGHLKKTRYRPLFRNIWGDAFYFVFGDTVAAARYALELRDLVEGLDWCGIGLPPELKIRIGLHAGPVFSGREPILGKLNFFGTHVNRAARIEPITSPGNVYASEQFAALLQARSTGDLVSRYVGIIILPKGFGRYPIYHIKRKMDME
jgi:class 3 adenylate cyclase